MRPHLLGRCSNSTIPREDGGIVVSMVQIVKVACMRSPGHDILRMFKVYYHENRLTLRLLVLATH